MRPARIVLIAALLIVGGFLVKSNADKSAESEKQQEKYERAVAQARTIISALAARYSANATWENSLTHDQAIRVDPVLTVELQRLWLTGKPILFIGLIRDVSEVDATRYAVRVDRALHRRLKNMFPTEFQLQLTCPREKIDPLLSDARLKMPESLQYGIPFVANITEIRTEQARSSNASRDIRVGIGDCVDIGPVGPSDDP